MLRMEEVAQNQETRAMEERERQIRVLAQLVGQVKDFPVNVIVDLH